ncbi:DUF72 domain-containing protein [Labrys neptuniae]|uniref:DUF72 domain-containing protein n=1 Tax=Labrys neptuniae TaxID=376174 RepID=A0ABV3PHT2_9HYPH|nr:DUF72 domain-containing protein [Labrys neptuniae]MDT3381915.1 DUF72 domain-containing protein [Labrys neptuniae]
MTGQIRVGIGGWTFEPWRGSFYPASLAQKRELEYASRQVTAIEINGTYYGSQKPESFAKWHAETPDDFIFAMKANRFATNKKVLSDAGKSIDMFIGSGIVELKKKLGPINWQFMPTKKFDPADFEGFLKLLPKSHEGHALRHVVEVRHDSFKVPEFIELVRAYDVGIVLTDKADFPHIHDVTAPFVYARLQAAKEEEDLGYSAAALDKWAERSKAWAKGGEPADLDKTSDKKPSQAASRDVFVFMINGFKPKAPTAARALIERL